MHVVTNVLISWMGGILPQCVPISNHHKVRLKYLTILFVNIKSWQKKKKTKKLSISVEGSNGVRQAHSRPGVFP